MTKALHKFTSKAVKRNAARQATKWAASCSCGEMYIGRSYESVEDQWRKHRWELNGTAPEPMGRQTRRWKPPEGESILCEVCGARHIQGEDCPNYGSGEFHA